MEHSATRFSNKCIGSENAARAPHQFQQHHIAKFQQKQT
jgi:hypothetical protein